MKKSKLTALTMAVSMMSTAFVGTMTANAEDVLIGKGNVDTGIDLVYNQSKSTATERYVDVYINGITDVGQLSFKFEVEKKSKTEGIIVDSCTNAGDIFVSYDDSLSNGTANNKLQRVSTLTYDLYNGAFKCPDPYTLFAGGYFGTMKFTVNSAEDTFYIDVTNKSSVSAYVGNNLGKVTPSAIDRLVVPAFVTEETVTAKSEAFVKEYEGVAAQAFSATLTAEQAAKSVTWVVTDGSKEKTVDTTVDTTVSGESDVVIGLVVSDAVEGLSATVTVK